MTGKNGNDAQTLLPPRGGSPRKPPGRCVAPRCTGRQLVLLSQGAGCASAAILRRTAGVRVALSSDFAGAVRPAPLSPGEGVVFERLGAALLLADPDQTRALARAQGQVLRVEPERFVRAHGLMGHLPETSALSDTALAAWGLQATRALSCPYTGRGVRVAILDTGLDFEHPDFAGRAVAAQSFIEGHSALDANGHGTFCAGVACGPERPADGPRYGVASAAELFIAKVLDDNAGGTDGNVQLFTGDCQTDVLLGP